MKILVIDIGGTGIKILATGQETPRKFPSGPTLTPDEMVAGVKEHAADWEYESISIGYPGAVLHGRIVAEPHNLGTGWIGYDFEAAFQMPVKVINDAAMQALGSYEGGKMLFIGLGTGLGTALIADGILQPLELGHLPYRKGEYEDYIGKRGLDRVGKKKWRKYVNDAIARLSAALLPDYVVIGGGNARKLKELPPNCRVGENANAFKGGFRLWEDSQAQVGSSAQVLSAK